MRYTVTIIKAANACKYMCACVEWNKSEMKAKLYLACSDAYSFTDIPQT